MKTMEICSSALRGVVIAPATKKLVVADLSNIEGRILAWLAQEDWKVKAFRDFDKGHGSDLYILAYSRAFGVSPDEVTDEQRQVGKVMELALGYQGGVGAFATFATAYGIDLDELAIKARPNIPKSVIADSVEFLQWQLDQGRGQFGLSDDAFIVCDALKRLWRAAHPKISTFWTALEQACAQVEVTGLGRSVGLVNIRKEGNWLRIVLPSGRSVCYPNAKIENGKLTYMGTDQFTRKWQRISTYGGKIAENITQAVSRDVFAPSLLGIEAAGFEIVLTVHDEVVTEAPDSPDFSAQKLCDLMTKQPPWGLDIPLAAKGFEAYRYGKG